LNVRVSPVLALASKVYYMEATWSDLHLLCVCVCEIQLSKARSVVDPVN